MRTLITNSKFRWFTSLVALTVITVAAFFLSNASAKQRRVSPQSAIALLAPVYVPGNFTFSTPVEMVRPISPIFFQQGAEPEVKIDIFGNIYVTAIQGVPGGVDLWKSIDNGTTFVYLGQPDGAQDKCPSIPQCAGLGGGDDSIDVSSGGYLYVSSLWAGNVTMSTSFDGGTGGVAPGQAWQVQPAASNVPGDDRQWIAAYGPQTVYMTLRQAPGTGDLFCFKSTDAGKTFVTTTATPITGIVSREGNLVVDQYNGNLYTTYIPNGLPNQIVLLSSTNGGATWTSSTAFTGPAGTSVGNAFTILSVDRGGNLHLVFTRSTGVSPATRTNSHVFLMSTANPSDATPIWTTPVQIDNGGVATGATVMPWVVAGSSGKVDITWYGSTSTSPDLAPFDWHVYFAQVTNPLSGSPTIAAQLALPNQVHDLAICSGGTACPGSGSTSTRHMLEYYAMTIDSNGNANIAFPDGLNLCPTATCFSNAWFTKQTSGPSAYTPPAGPLPATFATNLSPINSANGSGAEPNAWVDSHNCIFGAAIGGTLNPGVWKSTDAGMSFGNKKQVLMGSGVHGGDFDIITLPLASGARPDQIYTADLGLSSVHIGKSTDGGVNYFQPGTGGSAGEVSASSDRMWLAGHRGVPTAPDQTIYLMDHELVSEAIRFSALTNDTAWSAFASGTTDPELVLPPGSTLPNTNPGPVFVSKGGPNIHNVYGVFGASTITTNAFDPPFGKEPNVWEAVGAPPASAGAPPGPFTNHPVFKGLIDSPTTPAPPAGTTTYGSHIAAIFPSGDTDSAGNVYVVWTVNSARPNAVQSGSGAPTHTWDIWFAASHDGGVNFYGPWKVSSGVGTSVFPWIAAGDNGRVDITWYQSLSVAPPIIADPATPGQLTGGPNQMPAGSTWNVMFAQSLNANTSEPVFTVSQASDHIIHTGSISIGGLTGSSDRSLLDFFEIAVGPDGLANLVFADNGLSSTHISYARQNGGQLVKISPSAVTCLPIPPLISVVSRKVHGGAGIKDILLPLTGTRGVECRTPGQTGTTGVDYKVVFTFVNTITSCGTAGTAGGTVVSGPAANQCTENLNGLTNAQYITVTLNGVTDTAGNNGPVSATMGLLVGDTSANGLVNATDTSQTQAQSGKPVTGDLGTGNYRTDVNANGLINSTDTSIVQSKSGTGLPSPP